MRITFLDEAQLELDEAIEFYNNESDGLGAVFLQEVLNTVERNANFPNAWHPLSKKYQKVANKALSIWSDLYST